jgi:hypothetical protein
MPLAGFERAIPKSERHGHWDRHNIYLVKYNLAPQFLQAATIKRNYDSGNFCWLLYFILFLKITTVYARIGRLHNTITVIDMYLITTSYEHI